MIRRVPDAKIFIGESVIEFQVNVVVFLEQHRWAVGFLRPHIGFVADWYLQLGSTKMARTTIPGRPKG
jgi:hypothetical protein